MYQPFEENRWYKARKTKSTCPLDLMPYCGKYTANGDIEYRQFRVYSLLPRFCTEEEFLEKIDVDSPLTLEQAQEIHDKLVKQAERFMELGFEDTYNITRKG